MYDVRYEDMLQAAGGCVRVCVFSYDGGPAGGPLSLQSISAMTTKTGELDGAARSNMQAPQEYSLKATKYDSPENFQHGNCRVSTIQVSSGTHVKSALFVAIRPPASPLRVLRQRP